LQAVEQKGAVFENLGGQPGKGSNHSTIALGSSLRQFRGTW